MKARSSINTDRHAPVGPTAIRREVASESPAVVTEATSFSLRRNLAVVGGVLGVTFVIVGALASNVSAQTASPAGVTITVSPNLPADIDVAGGAPAATLTQAAAFAWQEFIALNWPAVPQNGAQGTRENADTSKFFGDPTYTSAQNPLVWHTYRAKLEIFPGNGLPPGAQAAASGPSVPPDALKNQNASGQPYYGYDAAPAYNYTATPIPPHSGTASPITPWINCDENSQIGLDMIYAGVASANASPAGNQILFMAKGSRVEFDYLAPLGWWFTGNAPAAATATYIQQNLASPPAGSSTYVSFPNGTIELKAAWRKLAVTEDASRFYTTTVRYYVNNSGTIQYVDEQLALLALHIIQKTPTAPYFIFATFEQADNITDALGQPVETPDGASIGTPAATALTPDIVSHNATAQSYQTFSPTQSSVQNPQGQLYYQNEAGDGLTDGTILVNRRKHAIPREIVAVNQAAHQAIATYIKANLPAGTPNPWAYYKLVNVQAAPIGGKTPGVDYAGADAATFYQANSVVETDYNLQVFSGKFYSGPNAKTLANTITDFTPDGAPFANVAHAGRGYNMGGCMGCHGNAQHGGADFSFILNSGKSNTAPDAVSLASGIIGTQAPAPGESFVAKRLERYLPKP